MTDGGPDGPVGDPSPAVDDPLATFYGESAEEIVRLDASGRAAGPAARTAEAGEARKKTVTGALMAGIAMGLREVFEPEYHDRIAIEQPAPELPDEPQKYELHLDPVAPESSFAIYRPWIDGEGDAEAGSTAEHPAPAAPPPPAPVAEKPPGGGMGALGG